MIKKITTLIFRIVMWLPVAVTLLIILLLLFIQTPPAKKLIVTIAEQQTNKLLDAELKLGELEGNFFEKLALTNISLTKNNDTILKIDTVGLRYFLPDLIKNQITINSFELINPKIKISQAADSSWNFERILKPDSTQKDTSSTPFNMLVVLKKLIIKNGDIRISALDTLLPSQIKNLQTQIAASYSTNNQTIVIQNFSCTSVTPDFRISKLYGNLLLNSEQIYTAFQLYTKYNGILLRGNYSFDNIMPSNLTLKTSPIVFKEFAQWIPAEYLTKITPSTTLIANIANKELNGSIHLHIPGQSADAVIHSKRIIPYYTEKQATMKPDYAAQLTLTKFDLRDWLNDKTMHHILNGDIFIKGDGFDPKTLQATIRGKLTHSVANGVPIQRFDADIHYKAGTTMGKAHANGKFGSIDLRHTIQHTLDKNLSYDIVVSTKAFDINPFLSQNFSSSINMEARVVGKGYNPKSLKAHSLVLMSPSKVMSFNIDTIYANIDYIRQNADIKSFFIKTLSSELNASGNYSLKSTSDIHANLRVFNAQELAALAGIDSSNTSGEIKAHLYGIPDSLRADLLLKLDSSYYKTLSLNSAYLNASLNMEKNKYFVDANAFVRDINASGYEIDSLKVSTTTDTKNYQIDLEASNKDLFTHMSSKVSIDNAIDLTLQKFGLNYKNYSWKLHSDSARFRILGDDYSIHNLVLAADGPDSLQTITAEGKISLRNNEDFKLQAKNLYLPSIYSLYSADNNLKGLLSLQLLLNGTASAPILNGSFRFDSTVYSNIKLRKLEGDLTYNNNLLSSNIALLPLDTVGIQADAKIPLEIRIDSMSLNTQKYLNQPAEANLIINKFPLEIAKAFYPFDIISGKSNANMKLRGTMLNPILDGKFDLTDGRLALAKYGIDYYQMYANILFDNRNVQVDTFNINSKKGKMYAKGNMQFISNLYEGKIHKTDLNIIFDKFKPINHKQYNMEVTGHVNMNAVHDSARFGGELTIPEAMIYLPAIMRMMGNTVTSEIPQPLLAAQLHKDSLLRDSIVYHIQPDTQNVPLEDEYFPFLKNLQGQINLKVPRNMWLKNEDMRVELSGDLQLIKHKDFFEIFGEVNTIRGQYSMLGKTFVVKSGTIIFEGGNELNPRLNIIANYSFRDNQRAKHDLTLTVGGRMYKPEISFTYEDEPINEGDAISYILFGTNLESVGGQNGGLEASEIAKSAAASLVSSQLSKLLGKSLNMDYIELQNSASFENASITVGKYITNKLFVSYEQNIGKLEDNDVERYNLRLEYELMKYLFFQLTSSSRSNGFDLIFKIDEKTNPFKKKK